MFKKSPVTVPSARQRWRRPNFAWLFWLGGGLAALALIVGGLYLLIQVNDTAWWYYDSFRARLRDATFSGSETLPTVAAPNSAASSAAGSTPLPVLASFEDAATTPTPPPTSAPASTPLPTPTPVTFDLVEPPPTALLEGFRFEYQGPSNCGPTTLAIGLSYWGWQGDQNTVAEILKPRREDKNVRWDELVYYVRTRAGWLDSLFRVNGDFAMLELFIANGYPVIIETGYYVDNLWVGHYLLAIGYDRDAQILIVHDATGGPSRRLTYAEVDTLWQHFNRLFILTYPVEDADKIAYMLGEAADEDANRAAALQRAYDDVQASPNNAFAWHNLGNNLTYFSRYDEAATAFDRAREIGLPRRMLFYQFGIYRAYFNVGRYQDVVDLATYTLDYRSELEESYFWRGWANYMLTGDPVPAIADFNQALTINPNFNDATSALEYFGAR